MKLRVTDADGNRQVRLVDRYDGSTRMVTLRHPLKTAASNIQCEILANNEDEVLTPFIHGKQEGAAQTPD